MASINISILAVNILLASVYILSSVDSGFAQRDNIWNNVQSKGDQFEENRARRSPTVADSYDECSTCIYTATDILSQPACCVEDLLSLAMSNCGSDGRDGRDGWDGEKGQKGEEGSRGVKGETGNSDGNRVGTSYINWGRSTCPSTSNIVYEGIVGGGYYDREGGAANYLCMPLDPEHLTVETGLGGARALIYTTEYEETSSFPPFSHLDDHDAPCALCRVTNRFAMIMIPAKTTCPPDWTVEYKGYLMTAKRDHAHQSEYLCVNENAEARPGTDANTNGALFYLVEASCGSAPVSAGLPCSPYVAGNELACVVCTI